MMKIEMIKRLLVIFAVLSLLVAPTLSEKATKSCACPSSGCHGSHGMNCCDKPQDAPSSYQRCICLGQIASFSGLEFYDPGESYFGKSSSRSYAGQSISTMPTCSVSASSFSHSDQANPPGIVPPDLDVLEYLPASAKQVFNALAIDGPLTKKDLIGKTDLPPRTVRYALSRLKGENMLEERFCFRDARQVLYSLNGLNPR
jgi:DNA-binding transcriptional ArsR family regulator